jgi:acetolactate synthase-1/3 small subunit
MSQHVISVRVENKSGVLARVAGLFSARGYNIDSLAVSETEQPDMSVMTIVARGDDRVIEQVKKQLNKLIDVIKVTDFTGEDVVHRELALVRVHASAENRAELLGIVDIFRCKVVDVSPRSYTLEVTGDQNKIEALLEILQPLGVKEVVRTGRAAISRARDGRA